MTTEPPANPRPIRAGRVWAGIGLAFLGHLLAVGVGLAITTGTSTLGTYGLGLPLTEFLVFAACMIAGILQLARGDRGLGVGLLVGWAVGALIFAGACVALILVVANTFGQPS
jgi:hypothetical protein